MSSPWALPRQITQYSEADAGNIHVSWIENENFYSLKFRDGKHVRTQRDLIHIARDPKHDILEKTYYLKLTDFNFSDLPQGLSGIEAKLIMNRGGRITDDTIQLCLNADLLGENQSTTDLNPIKSYGGESNLWGTSLTINDIKSSSFGIVLRFKSHPKFPHRTSPLIDTVELRIY
ncbi:MAG: hypothetical protein EBU90_10000 [Proteobacteria bacterium]|nr:hypothetical protein [Pseudomonadota bacterium]NBP14920.1 hypothetical protein [bacterium]